MHANWCRVESLHLNREVHGLIKVVGRRNVREKGRRPEETRAHALILVVLSLVVGVKDRLGNEWNVQLGDLERLVGNHYLRLVHNSILAE